MSRESIRDQVLGYKFFKPETVFGSNPISSGGSLNSRQVSDYRKASLESGTTIIAVKFNGGILLAADRRTTGGGLFIFSEDTVKIRPISSHSVMLGAGLVSHIQYMEQVLLSLNSVFFNKYGSPITIEGQARWARNFCRNWSFSQCPYGPEMDLIIAGFDQYESFSIYSVEGDGAMYLKPYWTTGSGSLQALTKLDEKNKELVAASLGFDEAAEVCLRGLIASGLRDSGSSDARIIVPNLAVINFDGFEFVDPDRVENMLLQIRGNKSRARGVKK